ncbi:unnamed protein product [Ectocarpus sp. 8 AP-2014]
MLPAPHHGGQLKVQPPTQPGPLSSRPSTKLKPVLRAQLKVQITDEGLFFFTQNWQLIREHVRERPRRRPSILAGTPSPSVVVRHATAGRGTSNVLPTDAVPWRTQPTP